jgi:hypothetical protein
MPVDNRRADIAGAIALPIGILAAVLSLYPVPLFQIIVVPATLALILATVGLLMNRHGRGVTRFSTVALVLALASLGKLALWLVLWGFVQLAADRSTS